MSFFLKKIKIELSIFCSCICSFGVFFCGFFIFLGVFLWAYLLFFGVFFVFVFFFFLFFFGFSVYSYMFFRIFFSFWFMCKMGKQKGRLCVFVCVWKIAKLFLKTLPIFLNTRMGGLLHTIIFQYWAVLVLWKSGLYTQMWTWPITPSITGSKP
jgi:hypothetical protein